MSQFGKVFVLLLAAAATARAQDFKWPVSGTVSQTFHDTFSGKSSGPYIDEDHVEKYFTYTGGDGMHRSIDIAAPSGTPVVAARSGQVIAYPDTGGGYGNHVVLEHGAGYFTLYAHLSAIRASDGQNVSTGELIGEVGTTGNSTGNHLHFEVRYDSAGGGWSYAIPRYYIPSTDGSAVGSGIAIPFDYPGIGSSSAPPAAPPTPAAPPAVPSMPHLFGDNPNGDAGINDKCTGTVPASGPGPLAVLAAVLLAFRRRRPPAR